MSDDKWRSGQWSGGFNRTSAPEASPPADKAREDETGKPPRAGLHDGPKPPGHVRADVDRSVREDMARARAFAKLREKGQTIMNDKEKGLTRDFNERDHER